MPDEITHDIAPQGEGAPPPPVPTAPADAPRGEGAPTPPPTAPADLPRGEGAPTPPPDPAVITEADYIARQKAGAKVSGRRNIALHKGGSVDIAELADGSVLAVVRFAPITDDIRAEVAPYLTAARAKAGAAASEKANIENGK